MLRKPRNLDSDYLKSAGHISPKVSISKAPEVGPLLYLKSSLTIMKPCPHPMCCDCFSANLFAKLQHRICDLKDLSIYKCMFYRSHLLALDLNNLPKGKAATLQTGHPKMGTE